jgi:hypothetical protein
MPIVDNRPGSISSGGGVVTINGQDGAVVLTADSVGAVGKPVSQGTPIAPLLIDNLDLIALNLTRSEILYLAGDGADFNISMANFTGIKAAGLYLKIVVIGAFALTFQEAGNFNMNGDRRCTFGSILNFTSDGVGYTEDGGNEIA